MSVDENRYVGIRVYSDPAKQADLSVRALTSAMNAYEHFRQTPGAMGVCLGALAADLVYYMTMLEPEFEARKRGML